jgi:hypothetical protein
MKTYKFYNDPGHGWLAVKRSELNALGIANKISQFSYQRGGTVYLEEDMDAVTFLRAKRLAEEEFEIKTVYQDRTPIRSYANYDANYPMKVKMVIE